MSAQPVDPVDPGEDPAAIFEALPPSHRAHFRAECDEALEAAHDLARSRLEGDRPSMVLPCRASRG